MKEAPKSEVIAKKKKELEEKSDEYRSAVTSDINQLKFDIERIGKNFLIIGGSLYAAYKLSKLVIGKSEEEEKTSEIIAPAKESSAMATKIKEQITVFLLALAFKKLKEFVKEKREVTNEEKDLRDSN